MLILSSYFIIIIIIIIINAHFCRAANYPYLGSVAVLLYIQHDRAWPFIIVLTMSACAVLMQALFQLENHLLYINTLHHSDPRG